MEESRSIEVVQAKEVLEQLNSDIGPTLPGVGRGPSLAAAVVNVEEVAYF